MIFLGKNALQIIEDVTIQNSQRLYLGDISATIERYFRKLFILVTAKSVLQFEQKKMAEHNELGKLGKN
jgi:hypothetical protein